MEEESRFTYRQKLFATHLLKQIGFQNDSIIEKYLLRLEKIYGRWDSYINFHNFTVPFFNVSECIEILLSEINLKKQSQRIKSKSYKDELKSATDLSNFVYCPISYTIVKSFIIEHPTGEEYTEYGTTLHEQLRLVNKITPNDKKETDVHRARVFDNEIIKKIRNSELIFTGHSDNKLFVNEKEKYVGQPDYIFKDDEGKYFVVEEKFHYLKSEYDLSWEKTDKSYDQTINTFFDNHKVQLISYIRNIVEYSIDYGYLIYWYYEVEESNDKQKIPKIHDVSIRKVTLTDENLTLYDKAVIGVNNLHQNQNNFHIDFDVSKLNINKCVGCVVSKYCIHKSGRYNTFVFPFQSHYLKIYYSEYPEELKKK
jgi:hypothetical protein